MKKLNINFKDRKILSLVLCLVLISVFTLTVVYAALNVVLTINGNARVSAADWDIYLNNPKVTRGSATTDVPVIKSSSTLEFETTLNMPGDFYEFVVDVVNGGDIDAMIENVVKTPELTIEQAKYLKYEITYQNGESISSKQTLYKDTSMPIKVRVEYRKDLVASDLPTGQVVLDLSLTLEYIQSDGTGASVKDNGVYVDLEYPVGREICFDSECFYVMYSDESSITLLSKYNLYIGNECTSSDSSSCTAYGDEATGKQDSSMIGYGATPIKGTIKFANMPYWSSLASYIYDSNSVLYSYVENYKTYLSTLGVLLSEARLISYEELEKLGCSDFGCDSAPSWVYATSYWTGSFNGSNQLWAIYSNGIVLNNYYFHSSLYGCRPVIVISKDNFN